MKATTFIIAAVLSLQVSLLFADNNETRSTVSGETFFCTTCLLAPVTPTEATFEETSLSNAFTYDYTTMAPVAPVEADFSDVVPERNLDLTFLAPVTPAEADFNETVEDQDLNLSALAPVTPAEADFE
jgi:hypothetical protein